MIAYLAELVNNSRYTNLLQLALTSSLLLDVGFDVKAMGFIHVPVTAFLLLRSSLCPTTRDQLGSSC